MKGDMASRNPPAAVRQQLAKEVGFGCPVAGCGSPYLTWHHFDPPWAEGQSHDPKGMIALCRDHHPEADAGAFTIDELRVLKQVGRDRSKALGATFNWMREDLVAVIGGNFYVRTPVPIQLGSAPVVWFNRDEENRLLVNLRPLTTSDQPRMAMIDNFWITEGADEREIICPPSGRLVGAKYPNGDALKVEFREIKSIEDFDQRFLPMDAVASRSYGETIENFELSFPMAIVEITLRIAGTEIDFAPIHTTIAGGSIEGTWLGNCPVGIHFASA